MWGERDKGRIQNFKEEKFAIITIFRELPEERRGEWWKEGKRLVKEQV